MATPTSSEGTSGCPEARRESSTSWPSRASWSSVTGRPLHALRTPLITLSRANGSTTPLRLTTVSCICSSVVNRRSQVGHWRRRRIALPSSATRESSTLESVCRQYGQCICGSFSVVAGALKEKILGMDRGRAVDRAVELVWVSNHNLWSNHMGVTTRYREGTSPLNGSQGIPDFRWCRPASWPGRGSADVTEHDVRDGRGCAEDQPDRPRDAPEPPEQRLRRPRGGAAEKLDGPQDGQHCQD